MTIYLHQLRHPLHFWCSRRLSGNDFGPVNGNFSPALTVNFCKEKKKKKSGSERCRLPSSKHRATQSDRRACVYLFVYDLEVCSCCTFPDTEFHIPCVNNEDLRRARAYGAPSFCSVKVNQRRSIVHGCFGIDSWNKYSTTLVTTTAY